MKRNIFVALIAFAAIFVAGCGTDSVTAPDTSANRTVTADMDMSQPFVLNTTPAETPQRSVQTNTVTIMMDSTVVAGPGDPTNPPTRPPKTAKSTWGGIKALYVGDHRESDPPPDNTPVPPPPPPPAGK